jgi:hypothetical protein
VVRIVFGRRVLLTLLLFGWLTGLPSFPRARPRRARRLSAAARDRGTADGGVPLGVVIGTFLLGRVAPAVPEEQDDDLARRLALRSAHQQRAGTPQ